MSGADPRAAGGPRPPILPAAGWIALVPLLFALLLGGGALLDGDRTLSLGGTDLSVVLAHQRAFGAEQLARGNLPLWNPHIFLGMPALGNIQMGLLYPPNLLYLLFPLGTALDLSFLLHLALGGALMAAWLFRGGVCLPASLTGGVLFLGCGANYLQLYGGQLPHLSVVAWSPLLFLAVDGIAAGGRAFPVWAGAFALSMMGLAGYPQFAYHFGVAAALYALLLLWRDPAWPRKAFLLAGAAAGAAAVTAWQVAATLDAQAGTVRGQPLSPEYAGMFSLPPENLLTLGAPFIMGGTEGYWGRNYIWAMELFVGLTALAGAGVALRRIRGRERWILGVPLLAMALLALGKNTPLFPLLHSHFPGFSHFRGHAKWMVPGSLFLIALAARGFHALLRDPSRPRLLPRILWALSLLLGGAGLAGWAGVSGTAVPGWWRWLVEARLAKGEFFHRLAEGPVLDPGFLPATLRQASLALFLASGTLALLALLVALSRRRKAFAWGVLLLAAGEVFLFDRAFTTTFPLDDFALPEVREFLRQRPGEYRILLEPLHDTAMSLGALDAWGYDPFTPAGYSRFMARMQGVPPETPPEGIPFRLTAWHPLLRMLRLRYVVRVGEGGEFAWSEGPGELPRALLLGSWRVVPPGAAVDALWEPGFDPGWEAVLEEEPGILPPGEAKGSAKVDDLSTDELLVQAECASPALLLITDQHHPGWRAEALPGSAQREYRVLRADGFLRAVPLRPGRHRFRLLFDPPYLGWARAVSTGSALLLLGSGAYLLARFLRKRRKTEPEVTA